MLAGPASNAAAGSLYSGPGPRPGPPILYQPLADAPQLQNTGVWQAPPILVSGASAYRDGEFLYQDFLYDDNGALGNPAQNDPRFSGNSFSRPAGTYTYPTDTAKYANNAADIVELRLKPLAGATAFRITLNTIKDADAAATTIALGGTPAAGPLAARRERLLAGRPLPDGPREHRRAALGGERPAGGSAPADREPRHDAAPDHRHRPARQLEPHRSGGPGGCGNRAVELLHRRLHHADAEPDRDPARRRHRSERGGVVQRGLPVRRAVARGPEPERHRRPGVVARQRPGARTRERRHQPVLRQRGLQQAGRSDRRRHARTAGRGPADGPDEPDPREPLRDRAGRQLRRRLREPDHQLQGLVPRTAAAVRDLRSRTSPSRPAATG